MKLCDEGHIAIAFGGNLCPLCALMKHNDTVHDFIESKGQALIKELVAFQHKASQPQGGDARE